VDGANIQIVHYFDHGYLEEEKLMIHSFTVTFGAQYLTGMVTSAPPYETFSLIKNNILHQSKTYKISLQISEVCDLGHVGHVTYSCINMLFISMGIFDDKLRPQILSVGTTANSPLNKNDNFTVKLSFLFNSENSVIHSYLYNKMLYFITDIYIVQRLGSGSESGEQTF
jgi:hypothetical protein